jgi:histone-lysine N-methyltransferase SETD8
LQKLRDKDEEGLEAVEIEGKGRGVKATRKFIKGELICEYSGDLIYIDEAKKREKDYQKDIDIGCYMYYFNFKDKQYCVDATKDNKRFGRLLNHCKKSPNVITKVIPDGSHPYLCLMAMRDIKVGEELVYDYGERDKTAIESHPWLTS